ncbi:MAG TPA: deoxynucleoside kinase [Burkholderiales bacterium]|nr:deoxynucleoside kinase [Burkholderiales bacterium]
MIPSKYRYIAIEGPIGVGKTSLAKRLATQISAGTMFEDPESNPFLPNFYRDPQRHALSTQLFFLFQRVNQVTELKQRDLFGRLTVSDFLLEKDPLFARLTLDDAEFQLYTQIYQHLKVQAPQPDLVIYLQAPVDMLIDRIQRRGIKMERSISEDYLRKLADSYTQFFYKYDSAPLLIVNSTNLNFVDEPKDFELLLEHIGQLRGPREFLNRAA